MYCLYCRIPLQPPKSRHHYTKKQLASRKYCNRQCATDDLKNKPEFLQKCRERMRGNNINVGRKHTTRKSPPSRPQEVRDKISRFNKGRYVGANNHFWKGGITPKNKVIRSSAEYAKWREAILQRDNWQCVTCGVKRGWNKEAQRQVIIDVDHIKPFAVYEELRFDLANGRSLCRECHIKTPTWGRKALQYRRAIQEIL